MAYFLSRTESNGGRNGKAHWTARLGGDLPSRIGAPPPQPNRRPSIPASSTPERGQGFPSSSPSAATSTAASEQCQPLSSPPRASCPTGGPAPSLGAGFVRRTWWPPELRRARKKTMISPLISLSGESPPGRYGGSSRLAWEKKFVCREGVKLEIEEFWIFYLNRRYLKYLGWGKPRYGEELGLCGSRWMETIITRRV